MPGVPLFGLSGWFLAGVGAVSCRVSAGSGAGFRRRRGSVTTAAATRVLPPQRLTPASPLRCEARCVLGRRASNRGENVLIDVEHTALLTPAVHGRSLGTGIVA